MDERVRETVDAYQRREKKLEEDLDALRLDVLEHVLQWYVYMPEMESAEPAFRIRESCVDQGEWARC